MKTRLLLTCFLATACGAQAFDPEEPFDDSVPPIAGTLDQLQDPFEVGDLLSPDEIGTVRSGVQWEYGQHYRVAGAGVWDPAVSPAIGVAYLPISSGVWATCGVTFISKHFAITAAHCVRQSRLKVDLNNTVDPGDQTFLVMQFDQSTLSDWNAFTAQAIVTGTWPNYSTGALACGNGYCASGGYFQCRVRYRCSEQYGWDNCPSQIKDMNNHVPAGRRGSDIAMIHCADRPSTAKWVKVDTGADSVGPNVQVWWSHEVKYLAPDAADVVPGWQPSDNWAHYGRYDGSDSGPFGKDKNYHYKGSAQPIMLTSHSWANGRNYYTVSDEATACNSACEKDLLWSDAFGCHGTSGSGVFLTGTAKFRGPYVAARGRPWQDRLCMDVDDAGDATFGTAYAAYVKPSVTRRLESIAVAVAGER